MSLLNRAQLQLELGFTKNTINTSEFNKNDGYIKTYQKYHEYKDKKILKIRQKRINKGWNLAYVSHMTGISVRRLNSLENITMKSKPTADELERFAKLYRCSVEELRED